MKQAGWTSVPTREFVHGHLCGRCKRQICERLGRCKDSREMHRRLAEETGRGNIDADEDLRIEQGRFKKCRGLTIIGYTNGAKKVKKGEAAGKTRS